MTRRSKLALAFLAFGAALLLSYDAYAGNLRSASTPSVLYWFASVTPDVEISYSGGSTNNGQPSVEPPVVLIDDIIYTGKVEPGESTLLGCEFKDQCSFWRPNDPNDPMDPGTLDFGPLYNHDNNVDHTRMEAGEGWLLTIRFKEWDQAQTDVTTKTRGWEHKVLVSVKDGPVIDQMNLIGSNTIAVKERREIYGQTSNSTLVEAFEDPVTSGDSGIGLGIGVGVGATSFMINTTAHRAYQTPYIIDGDERILVQALNWQWSKVMLHGRIVPEQTEFPTVVNMTITAPTE